MSFRHTVFYRNVFLVESLCSTFANSAAILMLMDKWTNGRTEQDDSQIVSEFEGSVEGLESPRK